MIRCFNCGYENEDGQKYCNGCGAMINVPGSEEAVEAIPVATMVEEPATQSPAEPVQAPAPTPIQSQAQNSRPNSPKPGKKSNTDTFCLIGFIGSIVSIFTCGFLSAVSLGISIYGLTCVNKNKKDGKWMAIAGIAISSFGLLLLLVYAIPKGNNSSNDRNSSLTSEVETTETTETTEVSQNKIGISSSDAVGMNYSEVVTLLRNAGFTNISATGLGDITEDAEFDENTISEISVDGSSSFTSKDVFPIDSVIIIRYHSTPVVTPGGSSIEFSRINYHDAVTRLELAGFTNIEIVPNPDLVVGLLHDDGDVDTVSINGMTVFAADDTFPANAIVRVTYHTYPEGSSSPRSTDTTTTEAITYEEINPDIPVGTTYDLGQGEYVVGTDIPAGRYRIEWIEGNQFGGMMDGASGEYVDLMVSIDPGESYTCILEEGTSFTISLITARFTKVSSLPNSDYLKEDGSYVFGSGYFFEGIDIPTGKYDITAISGNQFGINVSTTNNRYIALDINETYSNVTFNHERATIEVSLGTIRLDPK